MLYALDEYASQASKSLQAGILTSMGVVYLDPVPPSNPLPLFGGGCKQRPALWPVRVISVTERPFGRARSGDLVRAARRRFPHKIKSIGAFS